MSRERHTVHPKPHILIVEDDPDGRELLSQIAEHLDFEVDTAGDAQTALDYLLGAASAYTAIVIDLSLPDKNGWELFSEIQSDTSSGDAACIAVTAYHSAQIREKAITAGFAAYFPKPIDTHSFATELTALI